MRPFIISLLVIFAGCQYDPYTSVYTTTQPNTNDVVGVYVADTNTLDLIAKEGHYSAVSPSITLLADGTIIITNIPDWWLTSFGEPRGGFDSGRGTWTIQKHQEWWALSVGFDDTEAFSSRNHNPGGLGTQMMLIGEKPPYRIHLTVGDPDEGKGMQFERLPPEKKIVTQ
jgi:hypothetical protein